MNRYAILTTLTFLVSYPLAAQDAAWQPAGDKIRTEWAEQVDPRSPLPEYPRPQLVREGWQSLNGLWDYAIVTKDANQPADFQGKILVPFAVESSLSGVGDSVGQDQRLWYRTTFTVPRAMRKKKVLLHFGAVDWETEVWVNGRTVGTHRGGYDPFTFDITNQLASGEQELVVSVWDPTDQGPQPRGKQVKDPHGIWYTPVTGIWQTVWLEAVPDSHIAATKNTPSLEESAITVSARIENAQDGDQLRVKVLDGTTAVAEQTVGAQEAARLVLEDPQVWSPENPHLYDLEIALLRGGKAVDQVKSYSALRQISVVPNAQGVQQIMFNHEAYFQYGPLDQGWWPDGLYTAPTG